MKHLQSWNQPQAFQATKEEESTLEKADSIIMVEQLNAEEISKLKSFLKIIQDGSCSMAQIDICLNSKFSVASHTIRNNLWILDSRATDYMTFDINVLYPNK